MAMLGPRGRVWWGAAALFGLNALVVGPLFATEYTRHMGSIEGAYIGLSRWILAHPFEFDWFPLWYGGIPFQNTYPPLLHMLVAAAAWATGASPALAHHAVSAFFYCLGPVTLYWAAGGIGRRWGAAFGAGLLYSLVSPSLALIPELRAYLGGHLAAFGRSVRLDALVEFGEGPHITALALLPLAVLALHWALQSEIDRRSVVRTYLAAMAAAAVVLTNWIGAFALALMAVAYLLARAGEPGWSRRAGHAVLIGGIAYAVAAPWIPPSTLAAIARNGQRVEGDFTMTWGHLWYAAALGAALVALAWVLRRASAWARFIAYFALLMSVLVLASVWLGVAIMPQPRRYHLEMEMALCLALALGGAWIAAKGPRWVRIGGAVALAVLVVVQARALWRDGRALIQPIAIESTVEYQAAQILRYEPGRAYLSGSTQFWTTAFGDINQVGGGFEQGITNPVIPVLDFGIPFTEGDGERTAMWLRVLGASHVFVTGPESPDAYRLEWRDPRKFDGVLAELWRDRDSALYQVTADVALAHVVRREHVASRAPINVEDVEPVLALVRAMDDPGLPRAEFRWLNASEARIRGEWMPGDLLFVQQSYDPGWIASTSGRDLTVERDGLGYMVIDPGCSGACEVELRYDGGREMQAARLLSGAAWLGGFAWLIVSGKRSRRA